MYLIPFDKLQDIFLSFIFLQIIAFFHKKNTCSSDERLITEYINIYMHSKGFCILNGLPCM